VGIQTATYCGFFGHIEIAKKSDYIIREAPTSKKINARIGAAESTILLRSKIDLLAKSRKTPFIVIGKPESRNFNDL
jgi:uncharacterized protein (DUF433 family)